MNKACKPCPAGTEPILGYEYKWWNVLPANLKTSCFNVGNSKCDDMNGRLPRLAAAHNTHTTHLVYIPDSMSVIGERFR